ncbi:imidazole glycerol phosphate synthase subunit HisH [Gordonia hirsuta DSM 44140 = NBRC 16056]|uniref:Imidazole glycerol phosphate synthase subunit HisH n=1 Tax=Gordonia hirsuta DSM 44140 = NBRC 16056 TaxID=1121927 RepID=L7L4Q5_9ACTN|nr:imidazole glycerol phosphate synthase subunit HisH [Gordonia hirsuta]GAC55929.1 imidazole glycerol phosphate synthase subunit HisH [Gordonia hirsuta DSM 44140 = NBRC 16056]
MTGRPRVVLLDYGSGNVRSAQRALERAGAEVEVTTDFQAALAADGLLVPGVGAFAACMQGLRAVGGDRIIGRRLAGGRPVLGICVGMQVLFETGDEFGVQTQGCGEWPGTVTRLPAPVLPHMGWNTTAQPADSQMFAGLDADARFYFVHSYAVQEWTMDSTGSPLTAPKLAWTDYGAPFVAAVENGPLWATQFHPEKSGDVGATLLHNWVRSL